MLHAFARIGLISVAVVFTFIFIIFTLRTVTGQNPVMDPPHPWYKDQVWVVTPWKCEAPPVEGTISLIEIKPITSTEWVVLCKDKQQDLIETIKKFSLKKIMFRIETPEAPAAGSLNEYLKKLDSPIEVAVWSSTAAVGREIRKLRPDWIFAFDPAIALQFHTLNQIFLETWASLWADFWIEDTSFSSSLRLKDRARAEIVRRNKKIIAVDDNSTADAQLPKDAKGILTTRPTYWLGRSR